MDDSNAKNLAAIVGSIFRKAREGQRLSQEQVAALTEGHAAKISRTMISAIERGRSLPGLGALVSLSRVLNIEPVEILERVDLSRPVPVETAGLEAAELLQAGLRLFRAGEYREALAVYDAAAGLLPSDPEEDDDGTAKLRVWLEIDRSVARRRARALRSAQIAAQRAVELTRDVPELQTEAYMALASALSQQGMHILARDVAQRALEASEGRSAMQRGQALAQLAGTLYRAGEFEQARRTYLRARPLAGRAKDRFQQIKVEGNIGSCLMELGRLKQARSRFLEAVELARKYDDPSAEAFWMIELGRVALAERRFEDADRYGRAALRIGKRLDQTLTIFRAQWLLYRVGRSRNPRYTDRHRLAHLKKLWRELKDHRGLREIREFETHAIAPPGPEEDAS